MADNRQTVEFIFSPPEGVDGVDIGAVYSVMSSFARLFDLAFSIQTGVARDSTEPPSQVMIVSDPVLGSIKFKTVVVLSAALLTAAADASQLTGFTLRDLARYLKRESARDTHSYATLLDNTAAAQRRDHLLDAAVAANCAPLSLVIAGEAVELVGCDYSRAEIGVDAGPKPAFFGAPELITGPVNETMEVLYEGKRAVAFIIPRGRGTGMMGPPIVAIWLSKRELPQAMQRVRVQYTPEIPRSAVLHRTPATADFRTAVRIVGISGASEERFE